MRTLKATLVAVALLALVGWSGAAVMAQSDPPEPEVGCQPSASDGWTVADLSAWEAAVESGDYDQLRALFTDDGISPRPGTRSGSTTARQPSWGPGTWTGRTSSGWPAHTVVMT